MEKEASYSLLIASSDIDLDYIKKLLEKGVKIYCFVPEKMLNVWEYNKATLLENHFFHTYINKYAIDLIVVDGIMDEETRIGINRLATGDSRFNLEQYLVEHSCKDANLCIEAGAGTGKTKVMIDRIMYLFLTDSEFSFSKVAMITFTNKATDSMRHKLLRELNIRYSLTKDERYLRGLEDVSQLSISTIHSFFRKVITDVTPLLGYGTDLHMRNYSLEKKEILRDLLNNTYIDNQKKTVENTLGLKLNDIENLAKDYWVRLENIGLSDDDIKKLEWGECRDSTAKKLQFHLTYIFNQVEEIYNQRKLQNNAISMTDIIHELARVIYLPEAREYITSSYDYIFCDEFQDSDVVQIKTISILAHLYGCGLFVVGDIKQSIYRFRGATDAAFQRLKDRAQEVKFDVYPLIKNYRTSRDILDKLHPIFCDWNNQGFIRYETKDQLIAQNHDFGKYEQIRVTNKTRKEAVLKIIRDIMKNDPQAVVTILTRRNSELKKVREWCEKEKDLVHHITEKGSFFQSTAVLDLCAMLEGLLYDRTPMYLWELIKTPYVDSLIDIEELIPYEGVQNHLMVKIDKMLSETKWNYYRNNIKTRPLLAVIREIIEDNDPVGRYSERHAKDLKRNGMENEKLIEQVLLDTRLYKANLNKILQKLQSNFGSDFCSLYEVCTYLRVRINTDNKEEQAVIERKSKVGFIEGYTVHGAKGLEFEHVLIPFMSNPFVQDYRSEILISNDNSKVGWIYRKNKDKDNVLFNDNFEKMLSQEKIELIRDETRLLYVAMTRAIKSLYCFPTRRRDENIINDWSALLKREDDYNA